MLHGILQMNLWNDIIKKYVCFHNKCLTPWHWSNSWYRIARVARQAHRMTVTRRCVLPARWPPPRESSQPGSSPLWRQDEPKESYGTSQTCAAHSKLAAMGQRVITLRKENKKEVLAYFIFNGYSFINYLLFLLYWVMTSKNLHGILYCIVATYWVVELTPFPLNLF